MHFQFEVDRAPVRLARVSAELSDASDEDLVSRARAGDDVALDALLLRYRRLARARASAYFLSGADQDDLVQEAMIGLYAAVRDFDPGRGACFRTFAELCVSRQVLTAVRTATRHKHGPLNDYLSLHGPVAGGDDEVTLAERLAASPLADPAEQLVCAERIRDLLARIDAELSDLEVEVLRLHVDGVGYREIARRLARHDKVVDNALQRARRKLAAV